MLLAYLFALVRNLCGLLLLLHEAIGLRLPVGSSKTIPDSDVLPVVVVEVEVVHRVA
jgi:hypothetical protein